MFLYYNRGSDFNKFLKLSNIFKQKNIFLSNNIRNTEKFL